MAISSVTFRRRGEKLLHRKSDRSSRKMVYSYACKCLPKKLTSVQTVVYFGTTFFNCSPSVYYYPLVPASAVHCISLLISCLAQSYSSLFKTHKKTKMSDYDSNDNKPFAEDTRGYLMKHRKRCFVEGNGMGLKESEGKLETTLNRVKYLW